jgi:hypothetical protein
MTYIPYMKYMARERRYPGVNSVSHTGDTKCDGLGATKKCPLGTTIQVPKRLTVPKAQ